MSKCDVTLVSRSDGEREDIRRALLILAAKQWKLESIAEGISSIKRIAIIYNWSENDRGGFSIQFSPATYILLGIDEDDRTFDGRALVTGSMKLLLGRLGVEKATLPLARMTLN
jgi:hypothetical protein